MDWLNLDLFLFFKLLDPLSIWVLETATYSTNVFLNEISRDNGWNYLDSCRRYYYNFWTVLHFVYVKSNYIFVVLWSFWEIVFAFFISKNWCVVLVPCILLRIICLTAPSSLLESFLIQGSKSFIVKLLSIKISVQKFVDVSNGLID